MGMVKDMIIEAADDIAKQIYKFSFDFEVALKEELYEERNSKATAKSIMNTYAVDMAAYEAAEELFNKEKEIPYLVDFDDFYEVVRDNLIDLIEYDVWSVVQ